jgi:peptidyl-prolyl cis-trans isomerase D
LKIRSTELITRNSNIEGVENPSDFINAGFSLNENNKIHSKIIETSSGYYILGFKEKKYPEESEISQNLKTVKNEINWRKQNQSFQAWMAEIKNQYEIKYNPKIIN